MKIDTLCLFTQANMYSFSRGIGFSHLPSRGETIKPMLTGTGSNISVLAPSATSNILECPQGSNYSVLGTSSTGPGRKREIERERGRG